MLTRVLLGFGALAVLAVVWGCWPKATSADPPADTPKRERDQFAADRVAAPGQPWAFDGDRAIGYLKDLCAIGPRISGSEGMARQQKLLEDHFTKLGGKVEFQRFRAKQNSRPQPVKMANLLVRWHPEAKRRVLFCGHYDTRPIADQEPDPARWNDTFVSANDGTSTTAWLMEVAHHIKDAKLNVGIDFALFDGEEYVFDPAPNRDKYFFGSDHFADVYKKRLAGSPYYAAGVLLDLFAGSTAKLFKEPNSQFLAGFLVENIWQTAARLNSPLFVNQAGPTPVNDDHLALNRVGIPTVDLVDLTYPHWHRLSDKPEACSGPVMAEVARVLSVWVQSIP